MMSKLLITGTVIAYMATIFPAIGIAQSRGSIFDEIDEGSRRYYENKKRNRNQIQAPPVSRHQQPQIQSEGQQNQDNPQQNSQNSDVYQNYLDNLTPGQRRCMALEKELAQNWIQKSKTQTNLPQIIQEIRKWEKTFRKSKSDADRKRCYREVFLFGREFKNTRKCLPIKKKMDEAAHNLERLQEQRRRILTNDTSKEDYIISQLADYGCGKQYEKEDNRRNPSIFSFGDDDNDDFNRKRNSKQTRNILPFATYRTMCVRTCDGFYYPVSFSTLPSRFALDEAVCQNKCAAPAQLFVYKNPGETIEQMISLNGEPYSSAPFAFKYRKEYVKGCSCKESEFSPKDLGLEITEKKDTTDNNNTSNRSQKKRTER